MITVHGMSFIIQHRKCIKFSTAKQTQIPLLISAFESRATINNVTVQFTLDSVWFGSVFGSSGLSVCILECDEARVEAKIIASLLSAFEINILVFHI